MIRIYVSPLVTKSPPSIALYGATLTSWSVAGEELIFVSPRAVRDGSKAIRGGIPICWPAFGPWAEGAQHG